MGVGLRIELPYPPTVNTYWRRVGSRTLISKKGRAYRVRIKAALLEHRENAVAGRCAVRVDLFPPDGRKRDLDNVLKALLDGLHHGGVIDDDSVIDRLEIVRRGVLPGGLAVVHIWRRASGDSA